MGFSYSQASVLVQLCLKGISFGTLDLVFSNKSQVTFYNAYKTHTNPISCLHTQFVFTLISLLFQCINLQIRLMKSFRHYFNPSCASLHLLAKLPYPRLFGFLVTCTDFISLYSL